MYPWEFFISKTHDSQKLCAICGIYSQSPRIYNCIKFHIHDFTFIFFYDNIRFFNKLPTSHLYSVKLEKYSYISHLYIPILGIDLEPYRIYSDINYLAYILYRTFPIIIYFIFKKYHYTREYFFYSRNATIYYKWFHCSHEDYLLLYLESIKLISLGSNILYLCMT